MLTCRPCCTCAQRWNRTGATWLPAHTLLQLAKTPPAQKRAKAPLYTNHTKQQDAQAGKRGLGQEGWPAIQNDALAPRKTWAGHAIYYAGHKNEIQSNDNRVVAASANSGAAVAPKSSSGTGNRRLSTQAQLSSACLAPKDPAM